VTLHELNALWMGMLVGLILALGVAWAMGLLQ
jgi:hypothetical protein